MSECFKNYCYNDEVVKERKEFLETSHFCGEQLSVTTVQNALCIPSKAAFMGGVFDENNKPIEESFQRVGLENASNLIENIDLSNVTFVDKKVVYLGQYRRHHGSFLADSIGRFWYTLDNPQDYEFIYLLTQHEIGTDFHAAASEFFETLGIKPEQITLVSEPTRYKEILMPQNSYIALKEWHPEYMQTIRKAVENKGNVNLPVYDKIYMSRVKFSKGKKIDYGEEALVDFFKANGFQIIYPDDHTVAEEMFLVENCKVFASIGGAAALNLIFAKNCPEVIIINRMKGYQWHFWINSQMLNAQKWQYVDGYCEPYKFLMKTDISGPFLYWPNKFIKAFAKDNGYVIPKRRFIDKVNVFVRYTFRFCYKLLSVIKAKFK